MRRMMVPALLGALFALAACGAAEETGSTSPATYPAADAVAGDGAPSAPAADVVDAELRTITLDVEGMG